jgi:hypothetical protein
MRARWKLIAIDKLQISQNNGPKLIVVLYSTMTANCMMID